MFIVKRRSHALQLQTRCLVARSDFQIAELLAHGCGVGVALSKAGEGALRAGAVTGEGQVLGIGNDRSLGIRSLFQQAQHLCMGLAGVAGAKGDSRKDEIRLGGDRLEDLRTLHKAARLLELAQLQVGLCGAQGCLKIVGCPRLCILEIPDRFGRAVDAEINLASQNADADLIVLALGFQRLQYGNRVLVTLGLHENTGLAQ